MDIRKDRKEVIRQAIEVIQKDIFDLPSIENNLILLYQYPTSKVNRFYLHIEKLFEIKLKERPDTVNQLISIIIESTKEKWWV